MPSPPLSIVQSLSPRIAILSSDDVVASCEANGCRGLEELLRPWEGGTERVSILSSTLAPAIHPTFPLRFVSYASVFPLPEQSAPNPDIVVDLISSHVSERNPEEEQHYALTRGLLLSTRPIGPYETFNHPVGFMIAISTSTPEPMETLQRLVGRAMGPMSQAVPWLDGVNVMRFFVVLHDVSKSGEDLSRAYDLLASVKKTYAPHSTLLVINSQIAKNVPPLSPDTTSHPSIPMIKPFTPDEANPSALSQVYASALSSLTLSPGAAAALMEEGESESVKPPRRKLYGARLTAEDTQRLAALVRELVVQSLIPWMEGRIREWNEVWQTNRRGLTGRLFGAGRKLFGSRPSSPAPNAQSAGYNTVKGYYPVTAVEAITRRLADFGFMLRDYRFASTVYDSLRRDFAQDRAWRYAAASTEMYGLSLLLAHNYFQPSTPPNPPLHPFTNLQHTDISSWLEQAVLAYQGRAPANQIQLDALRVTVLYYEAWRAIGEWRGVGMALVKAAGEADEVPSAVMIEEAAAADVKSGKTGKGKRRRAFHLVLAAQRYETAGLKKYSRRCLERASQTYCDAPWTAAQARIEYSLARQAYTLGESATAVERFLRLLRKEDTGAMGSQAGLLEDMALAYEQLSAHPEALVQSQDRLQLPTPVFDVKATRIILPSSHASTSGTTDQWHKLEQQALKSWDRKGKKPMTLLSDRKKIVASVNEPFVIELLAVNPLDAPLKISELTLVTSPAEPLTVTPVADFELEPYESRVVPIQVVASTESTITITAASFLFHRFFPCSQSLERKGQRLHTTKAQRITPTYAKDSSLTVAIGQSRPRVELEWSETPEEVFVGEQVELRVRARNAGKVAVENLQLFMNEDVLRSSVAEVDADNLPNRLVSRHALALHRGILQPGEEVSIPLILSAHRPGRLDFLSITLFSNAENEDDVGTSTSALSISVVPLLALSAEVRPSRSGSKEYLVGIEATNISTHPVVLDKIEPISAFWNSKASEDQADLLPNQSFRSNHRVLAGEPATDLAQKSVVEGLSRLVSGQTDVSSQVPSTIALCAKPATDVIDSYLASRKDYRIQYLQQQFPTIPLMSSRIFPLIDPLDLDFVASWRVQDGIASRRGVSVLHGVRVSPEFSIVEDLRKTVQDAILKGGKTTRTMYEETGRLRQVLMDSVLDGVLSYEDDPLEVVLRGDKGRRVQVGEEGTASVTFTIRNRSPHLSVRWVLDLNSTEPRDGLNPLRFSGELTHRGQLAPFGEETVEVGIWALDTGLHGSIWTVYSETGVGQGDDEKVEGLEDEDKAADWTTRKQWVRREEGWVEVVRGL